MGLSNVSFAISELSSDAVKLLLPGSGVVIDPQDGDCSVSRVGLKNSPFQPRWCATIVSLLAEISSALPGTVRREMMVIGKKFSRHVPTIS